jgi:XTP/dITP diphosphohydrolase
MSEQNSWVLASHNAWKIKELEALLAPHGIALQGSAALGLDEPDETEPTFEGNAALKARSAWATTGLTCLSDDSGLSVDALGGEPGVLSARWSGPERDFNAAMRRVRDALLSCGSADRTARFVCVIALCRADGAVLHYRGEVAGQIVWPPRGEAGFGYDAIFQPDGEDRTFAEMTAAEKQALSHRGRALAALAAAEFGR